MKVKAKDLKLADVVRTFPDMSFGTSTVKQIKDGIITLFRPYVHTADFSYTGGVMCYIGIEEFKIPADDRTLEVMERKELK
jgi:hypothetical protein